MIINLKEQAVKGATVHFKAGGKAVVESGYEGEGGVYILNFQNYDYSIFYHAASFSSKVGNGPLDIIRIDPPAFDWSTAKAGMAFGFSDDRDLIYHYTIMSPFQEGVAIFSYDFPEEKSDYSNGNHRVVAFCIGDDLIIRAPEHDIEVK